MTLIFFVTFELDPIEFYSLFPESVNEFAIGTPCDAFFPPTALQGFPSMQKMKSVVTTSLEEF